jgi:hypothetical protein
MNKIKKIVWKSVILDRHDLDRQLTEWNFQPGKFVISHIPFSNNVMVTYVVSED